MDGDQAFKYLLSDLREKEQLLGQNFRHTSLLQALRRSEDQTGYDLQ